MLLRWGLGIVFLWIGIDILRNPTNWIGYVPPQLPFGIERELALQINGLLDVGIGVFFVLGKLPRLTAGLAAAHLLGILVTQGIDGILIRDVGLLGASLALLVWPYNGKRRKKGWSLNPFKRKAIPEGPEY